MDQSDDADLLRRYAREREEAAFAELVRRHLDGVYSSALRRVGGDTHQAEDVAQHVFAALAHRAESLCGHPALTGWLYTATKYAAANVVRNERRRKAQEDSIQAMQNISIDTTGAPEADWSSVGPILDKVLDGLNENDRTAVLLRFVDRRTFGEIGDVFRLTEDAARMRVDRALEKMRVLLARRGIRSSSAALAIVLTGNCVTAAPAALANTTTAFALAKTAVASASALTLINGTIQFMALAKSNTAIIVSVIVALAGTGVYEAHQASILKTQVRSLQQERNDATNQLATLRDQNRQLSEHQAALQKTVQELQRVAGVTAALDPQAAAAAAREKAEQAKVTALADGQDFLASYSQARGMLTEIGKAQIGRNYAAFYRMAGLSASQIEEFEKQTEARWMASLAVTPPSSVHPDQPELTDEQARNVLGEQAFAQFQLFKRLRPMQGMIYDMSSLSPNEPFTQDQTVQVLGILANACTSFQSGGKADPQAIDWSQVDAQVQGVLSETQIAALRAESKLPKVGKLIKEYYQNQTPAK